MPMRPSFPITPITMDEFCIHGDDSKFREWELSLFIASVLLVQTILLASHLWEALGLSDAPTTSTE